jgi:nicotinate phosphoribosyltransferase
MKFNRDCMERIRKHVEDLSLLQLTKDEEEWLRTTCPYLLPDYLSFLSSFRLRPAEQVHIDLIPDESGEWGDLDIRIEGRWLDAILYEVPLMAIISEVYFTCIDTRWSMRGQRSIAKNKGRKLVEAGIKYSEFGTRRRRSYAIHRLVLEGLLQGEKEALASASTSGSSSSNLGKLTGTSNVHFAHVFGLNPVGTVAHEWTMGIAAQESYSGANLKSLQLWDQVYSPPNFVATSPAHDLTIALTDTFSTRVFWDELLNSESGREIAKRWRGLRQDSGDSKAFARRAKEVYRKLGIDPKTKVIIYSDALNVKRCIELADFSKELGIGAAFGVGTHLTNDFAQTSEENDIEGDIDDDRSLDLSQGQPSKALNMVIKLHSINGKSAVKISDELSKNTGDKEEIQTCKKQLGIEG